MFLYDLSRQRKYLQGAPQTPNFAFGGPQVEVLRQHHLGEPKYAALGKEYPMRGAQVPERDEAQAFVDELAKCGLRASLGG